MKQKKLVLFTASYPFSVAAEDTFLDPELQRCLSHFSEITIIPSRNEGARNNAFPNLLIEEEFSQRFTRFKSDPLFMIRYILVAVTRKEFYDDLLVNWKRNLNPLAFLKTIWILAAASVLEKWLVPFIESKKIDVDQTLFYTFWCNEITLGLALVKKKYPHMKIISRANGYDIYEDQNTPPFIPFRILTFSSIRGLYTVSKLARDYLAGLYPAYADRMFFAHMGVEDPGFVAQPSSDGSVRIVSCAYIQSAKRIQLMADGIITYACKTADTKVFWTHIGKGDMKDELERYARTHAPENLAICFTGYLPSVFTFYRTHEVDFMINTSSSEGIPVSIMEAESCGIPVVATAVGGTPEIVSDACGLLLPPNPTPEQIAEGIAAFREKTAMDANIRLNARENWIRNYNAENNYNLFCKYMLDALENDDPEPGNDHPATLAQWERSGKV